ncbi:MAG: IclR family transcriptional regulator [Verrucomicrobiales bacterium]|nr:IclR family transcriptional regulator [Verrucomicrobiales bacterium]
MKQSQIAKTFLVLEAFHRCDSVVPLRDLALASDLAKPTVCRILQTLVALGYVNQREDGWYSLAEKFISLVGGDSDHKIAEVAEPILRELREQVRENVNLGILKGAQIMYRISLECDRALQCKARPMAKDPVFSTALGRALVAFLEPARQRSLLRQAPIQPSTPKTQTDQKQLSKLLDQIRQDGYAVEREQSEIGMMGVAAPILVRNECVASISIASPCARVNDDALQSQIESVMRAASQVSSKLTKI